jgi:hypothetical protein
MRSKRGQNGGFSKKGQFYQSFSFVHFWRGKYSKVWGFLTNRVFIGGPKKVKRGTPKGGVKSMFLVKFRRKGMLLGKSWDTPKKPCFGVKFTIIGGRKGPPRGWSL